MIKSMLRKNSEDRPEASTVKQNLEKICKSLLAETEDHSSKTV